MSDFFLELERLADGHDLSVFQYRLLGFYLESGRQWTQSLREIGHICKISPATCSEAIKVLVEEGLVDPYLGFSIKPGFVYLITDGTHHYKIGIAQNVTRRLSELQTGNPRLLTILAVIQTDDPVALENQLHAKYADRHTFLEWFALDPEDVAYIKGLSE